MKVGGNLKVSEKNEILKLIIPGNVSMGGEAHLEFVGSRRKFKCKESLSQLSYYYPQECILPR